jgi:hypothetical protein
MNIESIEFLSEVEDIFDDNIDVAVKLEDGRTYILVVATQKNLLTLMDNEKSDFLSAGDPMVIVKKLTKDVVEKAIEAYAEGEAYYLKFYGANLDAKTLDVLDDCYLARQNFDESINFENYALIDFMPRK